MDESQTSLGFLEIKKAEIPKFDKKIFVEKSQALKTLLETDDYF